MKDIKIYKAIFFDFDGVIGITMEDNFQAWQYAFKLQNIDIEKEDYFKLEGIPTTKFANMVLKKNGLGSELSNKIVSDKEKFYMENHSYKIYPGVEKLIDYLKNKSFLLGVVSSGNKKRLFMGKFKLILEKFDIKITGDLVVNGKPDPEPYLKASEILKIEPQFCLVVENAPVGIESAKRAGMDCIAISSTLEKKFLLQADLVVKNILEIQKFFTKGFCS